MKKQLLLLIISLVFVTGGYSQSIWAPVTQQRLSGLEKVARDVTPLKANYFSLNMQELRSQLQQAPSRDLGASSNVIIPFPGGDGKITNYRVFETSVMHPELAAKHTDMKTYVGVGIEDPTASINFSITLFGLHTMTLSANGTSYAEPFTKDLVNYIVYKKSDLKSPRNFSCGVTHEEEEAHRLGLGNVAQGVQASDGVLRRYRLAMASSIEYSAFHINAAGAQGQTVAQQKAVVLAAMVAVVTRINGIYEKDLSVTLQLVPNNENVIFVTGNDNLSNDGNMINQIQPIMNTGIGVNNYDIGHVVGTGEGGVAQLGSVCGSFKARGVTGRPAPVGDPFTVDYVAHEMGHQFGAEHTFNNSYQRSSAGAQAVEPGSGSTIMAYAGISPPDVQSNSDDYFHAISMAQIVAFINGGGSCAVVVPNNNTPPVIGALSNYTIPKSTAFVLRGSATDANNDVLTYCWEQTNAFGAANTIDVTPQPTFATGPLFRSIKPTTSPERYMPALQDVLNGNLTPTWEVVPSVARALNFALTVRDNRSPNGGQTARSNIAVNVNGTAGPFRVTSQSTSGSSWNQGSSQTVTWDVAGTTANNVNTANVNILLSTDGGLTFPHVLATNTPNDGTQAVTVPNVQGLNCRVKVEPIGNIYYAVNSSPFAVGYTIVQQCNTYSNNTLLPIADGTGQNVPGASAFKFITVPSVTGIISDVNVTAQIQHSYVEDLIIELYNPDGTAFSTLWNRDCDDESNNFTATFNDGSPAKTCAALNNGTFSPTSPLSAFNGTQQGGDWILVAVDNYVGDTGSIGNFSIQICSQVATAGVNEFGLDSFSLYPNPNKGMFTVEFSSASSNQIAISVHDISGRQILDRKFDNTGLFSGNINMGNVQTGVYLVTVQDGARKEVKRVVVE